MHYSDRNEYTVNRKLDTSGPDFKRAFLSPFFSLIPYQEQSRAIRTSISSAQTLQATCFPFCPATAAITPMNIFKLLVTTLLYRRIMNDQESNDDMASYLPGENLCVLYHNLQQYRYATIMRQRRITFPQ